MNKEQKAINVGRDAAFAGRSIALISMPTLSADVPSFQLALLKPTLERAGVKAQTFSMFLYFARHVGWDLNEALAKVWPCLVGEWMWAEAAFGAFAESKEYVRKYKSTLDAIAEEAGVPVARIERIRREAVPSFLDFCVSSVDYSRFALIGFTVVFQQMLASVALARALKRRYPSIPIVFGGATFEDDIAEEILRGCPEVDYVHCGDGDESFPEMVKRIGRGEPLTGLKGPMWREGASIRYEGRADNLADLDKTPVPDFDEYFYARRESGYDAHMGTNEVLLPIETARGCWWGMKHHCTFCGLNRAGMEFRAKSADGVIAMLGELSRKYQRFHFNAIDNIVDPSYAEGLFGKLAEAKSDVQIHYEIRPSVGRAVLKKMRAGGLYSVQPGVESFSTRVLTLMKKHTTGVRNVELLKWCTYYRINNLYNLLWGFAGETAEDYALQASVIPLITHFQPPYAVARARPDRGSPMFTDPERLSIIKLRPASCYEHLYPRDRFRLERVSYFFEHETRGLPPPEAYESFFARAAAWKARWAEGKRPSLRYKKGLDHVAVEDTRSGALTTVTCVGRAAKIVEACADARKLKDIHEALGEDGPEVQGALDALVAQKIVLALDDRYLTLALPESPLW